MRLIEMYLKGHSIHTHTPFLYCKPHTHASLQYNTWFMKLLGIVKSFTGEALCQQDYLSICYHFSPYYQIFFSTGELKASVLMFSSIQSPAFTLDIIFILVNHLSITARSISSLVSNRPVCRVKLRAQIHFYIYMYPALKVSKVVFLLLSCLDSLYLLYVFCVA